MKRPQSTPTIIGVAILSTIISSTQAATTQQKLSQPVLKGASRSLQDTTNLADILDPRKGKNDEYKEETCLTLLTQATKYDIDASGGLNVLEFQSYYDSLGGANPWATEIEDITALTEGDSITWVSTTKALYDNLRQNCHDVFWGPEGCADDTATDDETLPSEINSEIDDYYYEHIVWTEVKLPGFAKAIEGKKPNGEEKKYIKNFCDSVYDAMEVDGIELGIDEDEPAVVTTTTTESPIVENSTEVVIDEIVVEESTVAATTTEATQAASTETVEEEEVVTTTVAPVTTQVVTTTEPIVQPITLSFIASTGGTSDSTTVNTDDITDAMWKVIFDSLDASGSTRKKRQLEWDFGAQAAVYFESVTMAVDDVGKSCTLHV